MPNASLSSTIIVSSSPSPELSFDPIMVGAEFTPPSSLGLNTASTISRARLADSLSTLEKALSQVAFTESIPLNSDQLKEALKFAEARERVSLNLAALYEGTQEIETQCKRLENAVLSSDNTRTRLREDAAQILNRVATLDEIIKEISSDTRICRESGATLNLSDTTRALFLSIAEVSQSSGRELLRLSKTSTEHVDNVHRSQLDCASYMPATQRGNSQFEILATPTREFPPELQEIVGTITTGIHQEDRTSSTVIEQFRECILSVRDRFSRAKSEHLSKHREYSAEHTQYSEIATQPLLQRFWSLSKIGILKSIWNGTLAGAVPFVGSCILNRHAKQCEQRAHDSQNELNKVRLQEKQTVNREIRSKFAGTQFDYSPEIPREILRTAIPLSKIDSLLSRSTLNQSILSLTAHNPHIKIDAVDDCITIIRNDGTILEIEHRGDGRARIFVGKTEVIQKLGTAWSDDALTIARRFMKGHDLGIISRGPLAGTWTIPSHKLVNELNS
jgi:hypothetical protein